MALIKCPECGKEISSEAVSCPNCGHRIKKRNAPIVLLVLAILFALWVLYLFMPGYLDPANERQAGFNDVYLLVLIIGAVSLVASIIQLVNLKAKSKPLNITGIILSLIGLAVFLVIVFMTSEVTIFAPIILGSPILSLIEGLITRS